MPGVRLILAAVCVCLTGCLGGNSCSVSGQVTFDGQPISEGVIRFDPADVSPSASASASIINGAYSIGTDKDMLSGKFKVSVFAHRKTGRDVKGFDGAGSVPEVVQYIPARYSDQSALVVELNPGENFQDFKLEP